MPGLTAADLPEAFRPWFENRREIADLAIKRFDGGLDLHRIDDRYLRPIEIDASLAKRKYQQALEYSDGIVAAAQRRKWDGNPDRLADIDRVAPGEVHELTAYMLEMLKSEYEIKTVYGREGVLIKTKRGELDEVTIEIWDVEEGYHVIHNHPTPGMPPSTEDFEIFLSHWKASYGVLVNEEDGSITVYAVKAHPEKKFPNLEPKELKTRWKGFVKELAREHRNICLAGNHSLDALREAHRKALALLKTTAGDSVTINEVNFGGRSNER